MPHRSGFSHAMLAVFLSILWVFFNRSLDAIVSPDVFEAIIDAVAVLIREYTGLPLADGTVVTMVAITLVTVLGFAWGYTFHLRKFGRKP